MKRVAIVGSPGTGKTTFARKLHQKTKLPLIHLDYYYHQKQHNYYNDKPAWVKKVKQLMQQPKWIIDGNYSSTLNLRMGKADTVIFLDYSRRLAIYRIFKRRLEFLRRRRTDMPSDWKETLNKEFLKYVWTFNKEYRPKIVMAIQQNKDKNIRIFKTPYQTKKFLDRLEML